MPFYLSIIDKLVAIFAISNIPRLDCIRCISRLCRTIAAMPDKFSLVSLFPVYLFIHITGLLLGQPALVRCMPFGDGLQAYRSAKYNAHEHALLSR
jgi:hypothetical protein